MLEKHIRQSQAIINLNHLKKNYIYLRQLAGNKKVMAVVKADAYGHGVKQIVNSLNSLGKIKPEYYAVALIEEAIELRKLKIKQPILVFDTVSATNADLYFKYNIIPNVFTDAHLKILSEAYKKAKSRKSGNRIKIHIEVDTGMNRVGVDYPAAVKFITKISENKLFNIDGVFTHFATTDEPNDSFAKLQIKRFTEIISELKKQNIDYGLAHAANSGGVLYYPSSHFDMIRPGLSLYGYYPSERGRKQNKLLPLMELISYVGTVKTISKGESVSYGLRFTANKKTNIISVPFGYADGFSRNLTNKASGLIKGKLYKQIGTVTMDRIMFDIGNDKIKLGETITLLGKQKNKEITIWELSKILNSIPYEITCNISKRVPRTYNY